MRSRRKSNRKLWVVVACSALILALSVAGMVAYLTDETGEVTNTFAMGKLLDDPTSFVLKEHLATDTDKDGVYTLDTTTEVTANTYDLLPGVDQPKDPFVKTTEALKVDAYVFIEVLDETGTAVHVTVDTANWTLLTGVTGPKGGAVYVMKANGGIAEAGAALASVSILAKNTAGKEVTVDNAAVTDAAAQFGGTVKFYGYMIQAAGFENYTAAWAGLAGSTD